VTVTGSAPGPAGPVVAAGERADVIGQDGGGLDLIDVMHLEKAAAAIALASEPGQWAAVAAVAKKTSEVRRLQTGSRSAAGGPQVPERGKGKRSRRRKAGEQDGGVGAVQQQAEVGADKRCDMQGAQEGSGKTVWEHAKWLRGLDLPFRDKEQLLKVARIMAAAG
jgi:hypothetical protein